MPPTVGNGKICYLEIPASDVARSPAFYQAIFGWRLRKRGNGKTAFDDEPTKAAGSLKRHGG
jgi:hypothetical protein